MTRSKTVLSSLSIAAVAMAVVTVIGSAWAENPIFTHTYTADPQPFVWNDRLYILASNDNPNNPCHDYSMVDHTLMSTDDMANWTDHGEVIHADIFTWTGRLYAPGAAVRNDKVYIYVCGAGGPVGVAVGDSPFGPFTDPIGMPLVYKNWPWGTTNTTPGVDDNVEWVFDPAAFIDDDGQAYLYFGGGEHAGENLRVIKLNDDMISVSGSAVTIPAPRSLEASYMHKRKDTYYFTYSTNFDGNGPGAAFDYMTSKNPMGPFTYKGTVLPNPGDVNGWGNNHAGFIEYKDKWYAVYHDRRASNGECRYRSVSVDVLEYDSDTTMKTVTITESGPPQIKYLNPYDTIRATTMNRQSGYRQSESRPVGTGISTTATDVRGWKILTSISDGDWVRLKGVDFGDGADKVTVRAASASLTGGSIEFRVGSPTGTLIGTCDIAGTGGWNTWQNFECDIDKSASAGVQNFLYFVFKGEGEPFRLNWYMFEGTPKEPDPVTGYFFHHTFEDGTTQGWSNRWSGAGTVANTTDQSANDARSLVITDRGAEYVGPALTLSSREFVSGNEYSFSVIAMYDDGPETSSFKFTMQYNLPGQDDAEYAMIDSVAAAKGQWVILENKNFLIPENATNLVLYVEMPGNETSDFYIDDAMGGIAGAEAPGRGGVSSVRRGGSVSVNRTLRPQATIRGKTLSVSSPDNSELKIRLIDVRGKVRANFNASGNARFSLTTIPAGRYFIEIRGAGVRHTVPVVLK